MSCWTCKTPSSRRPAGDPPDQRTFVNIQHPGESTTYWNNLNGTNNPGSPTTSNPSTVSSWPFGSGYRPRPATVVIRKLDGGKIGS
jgi:secreted PhoX family phosphatase